MNNNRLAVNEVSKSFGDLQVLDAVDFMAEPGEFISIVGTSGCGKTTLLRIISGLDEATSGEVVLGEKPISGPQPIS